MSTDRRAFFQSYYSSLLLRFLGHLTLCSCFIAVVALGQGSCVLTFRVDPYKGRSLVAQMAKNLPTMLETWVRSLGWEDSLERERLPTPVFLSGDSHGQRSLADYSPWGPKDLDTTEWLTLSLSLYKGRVTGFKRKSKQVYLAAPTLKMCFILSYISSLKCLMTQSTDFYSVFFLEV